MHKGQSHILNPSPLLSDASVCCIWKLPIPELQLRKIPCSEPQDSLVLSAELGSSYFFLWKSLESLLFCGGLIRALALG